MIKHIHLKFLILLFLFIAPTLSFAVVGINKNHVIDIIAKHIDPQPLTFKRSNFYMEVMKKEAAVLYDNNNFADTIRLEIYAAIFTELDFYLRLSKNAQILMLKLALEHDNINSTTPLYKEDYRIFEEKILAIFFKKFENTISYDKETRNISFTNEESKAKYIDKSWEAIIDVLSLELLANTYNH